MKKATPWGALMKRLQTLWPSGQCSIAGQCHSFSAPQASSRVLMSKGDCSCRRVQRAQRKRLRSFPLQQSLQVEWLPKLRNKLFRRCSCHAVLSTAQMQRKRTRRLWVAINPFTRPMTCDSRGYSMQWRIPATKVQKGSILIFASLPTTLTEMHSLQTQNMTECFSRM